MLVDTDKNKSKARKFSINGKKPRKIVINLENILINFLKYDKTEYYPQLWGMI